ncbi:MAG TPA: divalent-cation tolerance protein CutA [Syntrophorhabdaceae bacterium]|nr:divalent-cation tolerance protein CutA [Syntrophorhabdaceae bacterium]HPU29488.1 divalent-cation tolerance protein CutA [Syntrophorhabdaceae bacterium]
MEDYLQIYTTTDRIDIAEAISNRLVEERLAACVQVLGPITSTYWWQGKIETSQEWLCIIKSKKGLYKQVEDTIKSIHHYDVPEIIAVPIAMGSQDYLNWLKKEIRH